MPSLKSAFGLFVAVLVLGVSQNAMAIGNGVIVFKLHDLSTGGYACTGGANFEVGEAEKAAINGTQVFELSEENSPLIVNYNVDLGADLGAGGQCKVKIFKGEAICEGGGEVSAGILDGAKVRFQSLANQDMLTISRVNERTLEFSSDAPGSGQYRFNVQWNLLLNFRKVTVTVMSTGGGCYVTGIE